MNMNSIFNFIKEVVSLLANWLGCENKEWGWCPIRVDNRFDRY